MPDWTIKSGTPQKIYQNGQDTALLLINKDAVNVIYIADIQPKCVPGLALTLNPGASVIWDQGKPLYALSLAGNPTLQATDNLGPLYDPAVLAGQIIQQGLAQQIANDIFIQGVPPANVTSYQHFDLFPGANSTVSQNFNMGSAVSFMLSLDCFPNSSSSADFSLLDIRVKYYSDVTGVTVINSTHYKIYVQAGASSNDNFAFFLQEQLVTPFMGIDITTPASTGAEVFFTVNANTRTVQKYIYRGAPNNLQLARASAVMLQSGSMALGQMIKLGGTLNFNASENILFYPGFKVGRCVMQALTNSALIGGLPVDFTVLSSIDNARIATLRIPAGTGLNAQPVSTEFYCTNQQFYINAFNGSTAVAGIELSLSWDFFP